MEVITMRQDSSESVDIGLEEQSNSKSKGKGKGKGNSYPKGNKNNVTSYNTGSRYTGPLSIKTAVPDITIINPAEPPSSLNSSLFCAHGDFLTLVADDTTKTSPYDKIVKDIIYWNYYDEIVRKANGNDFIDTNQFSVTAFCKWINAISNALQLYYNVESILAFNSTPENENLGLIYLQNSFNSGVRRKHRDLRDILTRMSIPRNMETLINYLYQNFSYCEDPQTPIVRINWRGVLYPEDQINPSTALLDYKLSEELFDTVINELNNADVRMIDSMIGVTAKYSKDKSRYLSGTSSKAVRDRNFLTWWHNQPTIASAKRTPTAAATSTLIYYGKMNFPMDGMIYALGGIFVGTEVSPALYNPWLGWKTPVTDPRLIGNVTSFQIDPADATKYKMISVSGSKSLCYATKIYNINIPTDETSITTTFSPANNIQIEFQKIQTHSILNMRSSVESAVRWLFS